MRSIVSLYVRTIKFNRRKKLGTCDFRDGCIVLHWFQEETKDVLYCCRLGVVSPYIKRKKTSNLAKQFRLTALRGNKQFKIKGCFSL